MWTRDNGLTTTATGSMIVHDPGAPPAASDFLLSSAFTTHLTMGGPKVAATSPTSVGVRATVQPLTIKLPLAECRKMEEASAAYADTHAAVMRINDEREALEVVLASLKRDDPNYAPRAVRYYELEKQLVDAHRARSRARSAYRDHVEAIMANIRGQLVEAFTKMLPPELR